MMLPLSLIFAATGLLFVGLSVPLLRRRVPPNDLYGLRVPATFADEGVWYDANARSGRDLLVLGLLIVGCAAGLPLLTRLSPEAYGITMTALLVGGALTLCITGWRRARRLLQEQEDAA